MSNYIIDSIKIKNFSSIYTEQTIDFTDTVTAFYGANASGKSNVWKALSVLRSYVLNSTQPNMLGVPYFPFVLIDGSANEPSTMAITYHDKDNGSSKYTYSFSLDRYRVLDEKLLDLSTKRERVVFNRSDGYTDSSTRSGFNKQLFQQTRDNSLLITQAYTFNNQYANGLFSALNNLWLVNVADNQTTRSASISMIQQNPDLNQQVLKLLRGTDFMIKGINYVQLDIPDSIIAASPFNEETRQQLRARKAISIHTTHIVRDRHGDKIGVADLDMDSQESRGTNAIFDLAVPIIDSLKNGKLLYIDEFNSSLHSDLCRYIISLFKNNKNGAKLAVNTHDTSLMPSGGNNSPLERDDIAVVEKDRFEITHVVPLGRKANIRKDDNVEKKYRLGLYGGKPFIEG